MTRRTLLRGVSLACFGIYARLAPNLIRAAERAEEKLPDNPSPAARYDDSLRSDGYGYMRYKGRRMTTAEAILLTSTGQLR